MGNRGAGGKAAHPLRGVFVVDCKLGSDPRGRCRSSAIIVAAVFKPRRGSCSTGSSKFDHSPSGVNDHHHHESSAKLIAEAEPSVCTDRLTLVSEFGSSFRWMYDQLELVWWNPGSSINEQSWHLTRACEK